MQRFEKSSEMPGSAEALWQFHSARGAFERLTPPWERVRLVIDPGSIQDGLEPQLEVRKGPLRREWVARYERVTPGAEFTDVLVRGPLPRWEHRHLMEDVAGSPGTSRLTDRVCFELPLKPLGALLGAGAVRRQLDRMFRWRHAVTRLDLEDRERWGAGDGEVVVTGASGLVGRALVPALQVAGFRVLRAVRREPRRDDELEWQPAQGFADPARLEGLSGFVHLAGANIAEGRWTDERKAELLASRVPPTERIAEQLAALKAPPSSTIFASAVGYYGSRPRGRVDEQGAPGDGFVADLCQRWEAAADPLVGTGARVVQPRLGIVLSAAGGALAKMLPPFRLGVGGPLGHGAQAVPWISVTDLVRAFRWMLLDDQVSGPVNCVAPEAVDNRAFSKTLGRVLRRPAVLPAPAFALRLAFGREMADQVLLGGVDVAPGVLLSHEFPFETPRLEMALRHVLGRERST